MLSVLSVIYLCCVIYLCYLCCLCYVLSMFPVLSELSICYQYYLYVICVVCVTSVICLCYLCYLSVLGVLSVCVICVILFQLVTRAQSRACCVQCCFKRAERNKTRWKCFCHFLWHIGERLQAQGMWGLSTQCWCGCSELSLSPLTCCGQPKSAPRSREISCGRRQSPQIEDPVSHSWLP